MGAIHVEVTIRNPGERSRSWAGPFLVDTGATDSIVPRRHLEGIGLEPVERMVYELADGTRVPMDVGVAQIEFMGKRIGGTVVFGDAEAEPLLGVTALESMGVVVDPGNQRLTKLPAVRLKAAQATQKLDRLDAYRRILKLLADLEPFEFPITSSRVRVFASEHDYNDIATLREDYISLYCQHLGEKGYVEVGNVQRSIGGEPPEVLIYHVTSVGYDVAELSSATWRKVKTGMKAALPFARDLASMLPHLLAATT